MKRYAAFLRGVMPTNCKMADLQQAFEAAGFTDVRTVLGSGNVAFSAPATPTARLERQAEAAMDRHLGKRFLTIVRSMDELAKLLATDPYKGKVPAEAKRNVTFLRAAPRAPTRARRYGATRPARLSRRSARCGSSAPCRGPSRSSP